MKKDIFGRKLEEGSIVVVKATGRDSSGLKAGILLNDLGSVLIYGPDGKKTEGNKPLAYNEYFLVENPSEMEKQLAAEVLNEYKNKKVLVPLKLADMKHLHLYTNKQETTYVFVKNLMFDLYLIHNNTKVASFNFTNHFIQYDSWWNDLPAIATKRKKIPTLYFDEGPLDLSTLLDHLLCKLERGVIVANEKQEYSFNSYTHGLHSVDKYITYAYIKELYDSMQPKQVPTFTYNRYMYAKRDNPSILCYLDNVQIF